MRYIVIDHNGNLWDADAASPIKAVYPIIMEAPIEAAAFEVFEPPPDYAQARDADEVRARCRGVLIVTMAKGQ